MELYEQGVANILEALLSCTCVVQQIDTSDKEQEAHHIHKKGSVHKVILGQPIQTKSLFHYASPIKKKNAQYLLGLLCFQAANFIYIYI